MNGKEKRKAAQAARAQVENVAAETQPTTAQAQNTVQGQSAREMVPEIAKALQERLATPETQTASDKLWLACGANKTLYAMLVYTAYIQTHKLTAPTSEATVAVGKFFAESGVAVKKATGGALAVGEYTKNSGMKGYALGLCVHAINGNGKSKFVSARKCLVEKGTPELRAMALVVAETL